MRFIAIILATMLLVMGCSNDAPDEPRDTPSSSSAPGYGYSAEEEFVRTVTEKSPQLSTLPEQQLIDSGRDACDGLEMMEPEITGQEFVIAVESFSEGTSGLLTPDESAYFIGAASGAFCPEYMDDIQALAGGNV